MQPDGTRVRSSPFNSNPIPTQGVDQASTFDFDTWAAKTTSPATTQPHLTPNQSQFGGNQPKFGGTPVRPPQSTSPRFGAAPQLPPNFQATPQTVSSASNAFPSRSGPGSGAFHNPSDPSGAFPATSAFPSAPSSTTFNPQSNFRADVNQGVQDVSAALGINPLIGQMGQSVMQTGLENTSGMLHKYIPGWLQQLHQYFRVTHKFVFNKFTFLLFPFRFLHKSKMSEDMQRADLYVPLMAYITYVLLYGICRGIHHDFHPELLGSTATFALVLLILEILLGQMGFFLAGTSNMLALDIASYSGYKYVPLVILLSLMLTGLCDGFLYYIFVPYLACTAGVSMYCAMSSKPPLKAMQGNMGEIANDSLLHSQIILVMAGAQVALCWLLTPSLTA